MPAERWVHLQRTSVATLNRYMSLPHCSVTTEVVGSLWRCQLDKLQVRLVLLRWERAVRTEPEQGMGLGVGEGFGAGLRQEWSLVDLWIPDRRTLCTCNPLLAFPQQGSGWTDDHKSKVKVTTLLQHQIFSMLQKGEKYFALLRIQKMLEHRIYEKQKKY